MEYNRLGKAGIKLSELSFGSWVTFGSQLDVSAVRRCMHAAFDAGVNFFDNAELYAKGAAESLMGIVAKDFRREDLVLSTKIFWGGSRPNQTGLSRKHLIEGTKNSLKRLQLDYVDLLFCHRPDPETPIEETVLAMDYLVRSGLAFYWGTSEWSAEQIETAYRCAAELHCIPPSMEQPQYNLFHRERVEVEYAHLYEKYGLGTTIWSPLASGMLTGKYAEGVPPESRLARETRLFPEDFDARVAKTQALAPIAQELNSSLSQLALAWCLMNPQVSTVMMGASSVEQLQENLGAIAVKAKLTPEYMDAILAAVA